MACTVTYKGIKYSEEEYNNVVSKLYSKIDKDLKGLGFKKTKSGLFEGVVHGSNVIKQHNGIADLNSKYKDLSIDSKPVLKKVVTAKSKNLWELNLNGVIPVFIDAYRREKNLYGNPSLAGIDGEVLYRIKEEVKAENNPITKLEKSLVSFLRNNGIRVEVLDTIKTRLGVDAVGAYNTVEKLVLLAKDRDYGTLPEETGHVIIETLGKDHPLVKSLLFNIQKTKLANEISPEYAKEFAGREDLLVREVAAKIVGEAIVKGFDSPKISKVKSIIEKIFKAFKRIFNLDTSNLKKEYSQIYTAADVLAKQVLTDSFVPEYSELSQTVPDHPIFYRLNTERKIVDPDKIKDKEIYSLQRKRVKYLQNRLKNETDPAIIQALESRIQKYNELLLDFKASGKRSDLINVSKYTMENIENLLTGFEAGEIKIESITGHDINFMYDSLNLFRSHPSLSGKANELKVRLKPILEDIQLKDITKHRTDGVEYTWEDVMEQEEDVSGYTKNIGALADVESVLGSTIGSMIKEKQNSTTTYNQKIGSEIKDQVAALKEAQARRGVSEDNMYDIFISEGKNTTYLVSPYNSTYWADFKQARDNISSGEAAKIAEGKNWFKENKRIDNPTRNDVPAKYRTENYFIIQEDAGLKKFYDFYQQKIEEAFGKLPTNRERNFIPNIKEHSLKELVKTKGLSKAFGEGWADFLRIQEVNEDVDINEEEQRNNIPVMFVKPLKGEKKSKDLGNSLNIFMRFANNHNEMTNLLPRLRLLQETVATKNYITSFNESRTVSGQDTNLYKMIDAYIDMQVRGKMKKDSDMKFTWDSTDSEGNQVKKVVHLSTLGDRLLGYNSLLRIGLNPLNAISNVGVGEISNFMESVGSQFFSAKDLNNATSIFFKELFNEESKMHKIIEVLNPLQELEDYEALTGTAKKMSKEKLKELAFSLQRKGEFFLQVRPMIASMLSDKIEDKDGNSFSLWEAFDEKGVWKSEQFGELTEDRINKMSNRIQRINQIIHGRYSSRDAATASQHVLMRAVMQFRKWIPSALESRFTNLRFDNRLGETVEGRWRTLGRLTLEAFNPNKRSFVNMITSLMKDKEKLVSGQDLTPSERANMRKNAIEAVLIGGSIVFGYLLLGGDDDKDKIVNPWAKMAAEQLNRISGDLLYFMNPREYISLGRNAIPAAKTLGDLYTTLTNIQYMFGGEDSEYRSGPRKNESKFYSRLGSIIVGAKPITDLARFFNEEPYIKIEKQ